MDSALSWRFAARRSAPSMVVPLISAATLSAGRHQSALRVSLSAPLVYVASFGKGTTIPCRTRLARNADKLTESINLTWTEYQSTAAKVMVGQLERKMINLYFAKRLNNARHGAPRTRPCYYIRSVH